MLASTQMAYEQHQWVMVTMLFEGREANLL